MSDNFFEVVEDADTTPTAPVKSYTMAANSISKGEVRLLQTAIEKLTDERATSCILPDIFYKALQNNISAEDLDEWGSVVIAMSNNIDAPWVQAAISDCYKFWTSEFITNYIHGFFESQRVKDELIPALSEQMISHLPTVYQQEQSPEEYKLYKAVCVQIALTGTNYPVYAFNSILSGEASHTVTDVFPMPSKPKTSQEPVKETTIWAQAGKLAGKIAAIPDEFNTGVQDGLGQYAETHNERKAIKTEQRAAKAEQQKVETANEEVRDGEVEKVRNEYEHKLELERQKWQLENEQLRNSERARRQQEYINSVRNGTIQQRNKGYANTNVNFDYSPHIPLPMLVTGMHAIIALVVYFLDSGAGMLAACALLIASIGWFTKDKPKRPGTKITPGMLILIGYAIFIVSLVIIFK